MSGRALVCPGCGHEGPVLRLVTVLLPIAINGTTGEWTYDLREEPINLSKVRPTDDVECEACGMEGRLEEFTRETTP